MTQPLRRIVVGSSLAPASDGVLASALAFARLLDARLEVVHAYLPSMPYIGEPFPVTWFNEELLADHEAALERTLAAQAERVGARPGEIAGFRVSAAPPALAIEEAAKQFDADLIVVGPAESGSRIARRLLGSTSDRLLRHSARPILLARGAFREAPREVLLPVDFSPSSKQALTWADGLLRSLAGARWPTVEALFVLSPFPEAMPLQFDIAQVERFALEELEGALDKLGSPGPIGRRLRTGRPSEEILAEIHHRGVDLAILGTHGRSGLERFMLGSVAGDVARDARCSVIVVPPAVS
ncbi:MAG: universal stress protein [Thermoanaerobaculia bacterium]